VFIVAVVISPAYGEIGVSVGIPYPRESFKEAWDPKSSMDVRLGFGSSKWSPVENMRSSGAMFLRGIQDNFVLNDALASEHGVTGSKNAKMQTLHIGGILGFQYSQNRNIAFGPVMYHGVGVSKFMMPDDTFNQLGESTRMELEGENNDLQFSSGWGVGVSFTGFDCISLKGGYEFVSVEKDFLTDYIIVHSLLSGIIQSSVIQIPPAIVYALFPEMANDNIIVPLACLAYVLGAGYATYQFDYENNNWPFDDPTPMHYSRAMVTAVYEF